MFNHYAKFLLTGVLLYLNAFSVDKILDLIQIRDFYVIFLIWYPNAFDIYSTRLLASRGFCGLSVNFGHQVKKMKTVSMLIY